MRLSVCLSVSLSLCERVCFPFCLSLFIYVYMSIQTSLNLRTIPKKTRWIMLSILGLIDKYL